MAIIYQYCGESREGDVPAFVTTWDYADQLNSLDYDAATCIWFVPQTCED